MHCYKICIPNFNGKIVGKYQFKYIIRTRSTPGNTNLLTDVYCLLSEFNLFHCKFFIQTNKNLWNWLHFTSIKSMFIVFVNKTIGLPVFPAQLAYRQALLPELTQILNTGKLCVFQFTCIIRSPSTGHLLLVKIMHNLYGMQNRLSKIQVSFEDHINDIQGELHESNTAIL